MKRLIYMIILVLSLGCAAIRKSERNTSIAKEQRAEVKLRSQNHHIVQTQLNVDSTLHHQWLKIYPAGKFSIDQKGFSGSADSLIWYGKAQAVNKKQHWKEDNMALVDSNVSNYSILAKQKQKTSEKKRVTVGWLMLGCILIMIVVCIAVKYVLRRILFK